MALDQWCSCCNLCVDGTNHSMWGDPGILKSNHGYKSCISSPSWSSRLQRSCWKEEIEKVESRYLHINTALPEWMIKVASVITNGMVLVWVTLLPVQSTVILETGKHGAKEGYRSKKRKCLRFQNYCFFCCPSERSESTKLTWIGYLSPQELQREASIADNARCRRASHVWGSTEGWWNYSLLIKREKASFTFLSLKLSRCHKGLLSL